MLWECAEYLECECMEMYHTIDGIRVHRGIMRKEQFLRLRHENEGVGLHELWLGLLEIYSSRDLSYNSDLLPALSGLAKLWQSRGAGKYLAGFWEEYILESMMWNVHDLSPSQIQRSIEYRAPSWSPFSLEEQYGRENRRTHLSFGFPTNYERLAERCAAVLDAGSTPMGADPTGQVASGFLRLKGHVIRKNVSSKRIELRGEYLFIDFDFDINFGGGIDLTFLLIGYNTLGGLIALVLQHLKQSGVYERVGIASCSRRKQSQMFVSQFFAVEEETVVII
ncbi:hypothetical protein GQ607_012391 [Colletotrichum asianum]|uniref:Uncharacterized protein n=1 Tax=Colletotrichum asianum TaxID=702518 RepID=A0A8H3W5M3_9PEZI|nr:hypothetical protein GQ607_012391 [Colletotrichum asianum]